MMEDLVISTAYDVLWYSGGQWISLLKTKDIDFKDKKIYGLSWSESEIFVGCVNQLTRISKKTVIEKLSIENSHQYHWDGKQLCIACDSEDKIIRITPDLKITKSEQLSDDGKGYINSVFYHSDSDRYFAAAHNLGNPSYIVELNSDLKIVNKYSNLDSYEIHNVYYENKNLFFLNSLGQEIVVYDTESKKVLERVSLASGTYQKYPRGLARSEDGFYVGLAINACFREQRNEVPCHIVYLNNCLQKQDEIEVPNKGQIREVRLTKNDAAHNKINFPTKALL